MKEIVIKMPDEVYERLFTMKPMDLADNITIDMAIKNGKVLPKGHGELKDTSVLRENYHTVFNDDLSIFEEIGRASCRESV